VSAPSHRTKSNHDLADRQARARLNLEYRQARLRETVEDQIGVSAGQVGVAAVQSDQLVVSAVDDTTKALSDVTSVISSAGSISVLESSQLQTGSDHQKLE